MQTTSKVFRALLGKNLLGGIICVEGVLAWAGGVLMESIAVLVFGG